MRDDKFFVVENNNGELALKEFYRRAFKDIGIRLDNEFYKRVTANYLKDNFHACNKWYNANYKRFTHKKWNKLVLKVSGYLFDCIVDCIVSSEDDSTIKFTRESSDLYSIKDSHLMFLASFAIKQLYGKKWATIENAELVIESLFFNDVIGYKKMNDNSLKYVISKKQFINIFDKYMFNIKQS